MAEGCIELSSTSIGRTGSAKEVTNLTRRFELVAPDVLRYVVGMAAVGEPLQSHLSAELHRGGAGE